MDYEEELRDMAHGLQQVALQIYAHLEDPEGGHLKTRQDGRITIQRRPALRDHRPQLFIVPTFEEIRDMVYHYAATASGYYL